MENNLEKDEQEKKIEDIAEQDWPYLKELETTRFALKNKKDNNRKKQTLQAMKKRTEKEDQAILEQNLEDEKLVEAFLNVMPASTEHNEVNKNETDKDVELSKLIARGMAKTYISKTDTILNPLRFILSNSKQLG